MLFGKRKSKTAPAEKVQTVRAVPVSSMQPLSVISSSDPEFSDDIVISKIVNLWMRLQIGLIKKDLSDIKPYLSDELFGYYSDYLSGFAAKGQTAHTDSPTMLGSAADGCAVTADGELLYLTLNTRAKEYVTDDASGRVISGDRETEWFSTWQLVLSRPAGVKTPPARGVSTDSCLNCGAHADLMRTSVCPYCGSLLRDPSFVWTVSSLSLISRTD